MDCLICNNVNFDGHQQLDQKSSSTFCKLLDIPPTTFAKSSSSVICPACCGRLLEIHKLYNQLEVIKVRLDYFRREIIEDLLKSQGSNEGFGLEERTKIIQEIGLKVYEKLNDDGSNGSKSRIKTENLDEDKSIQNFFENAFFDNFDDHDSDSAFAPPNIAIKNAQIILERIQLPPLESSIQNSYNITQEPIASFITRDQVRFKLLKPSSESTKIKKSRGVRPKKTMGKSNHPYRKKRGPRPKIFYSHDEKILQRRKKILKQISDGITTKYNCKKKKTEFLCSNCGLSFARIARLIEHQRIHTGERPFKCDVCGKGCRTKKMLVSHLISHGIGASAVQCSICSTFMSKSVLKTHMDRHEGLKNHLCDFCAMSFTTNDSLQKHRDSIHSENKLNCPRCDKVFNRKSNLKEHILKYHEKKFDVSCPECNKSYINNARMQVHRRSVHFKELIVQKEVITYPCNFCDRSFKSRLTLDGHIIILHTQDKDLPFKCTIDGCKSRGFMSKHKLSRHMLIHSGKIDHICPYCAKGYAVKTSLNTHIKHYCKQK